MKKIISVLAMALLVIGAAQAQNQVRKMVVRTTDGEVVKYKTANVEEVTFEEATVPTTVEEAETMLVGYWKCNNIFLGAIYNEEYGDEEYGEVFVNTYFVITEGHDVYLVCKVSDSYPYNAGKFIVLYNFGDNIIVNSEDPTAGYLYLDEHETWGNSLPFKNLEQDSFEASYKTWQVDEYNEKLDGTFTRVEPFEYIFMEDGIMKNGLMKI